jgi:hypothetical protein
MIEVVLIGEAQALISITIITILTLWGLLWT